MDNLGPQQVDICLAKRLITFPYADGVSVPIKIQRKENHQARYPATAARAIKIAPLSVQPVPLSTTRPLSDKCDFELHAVESTVYRTTVYNAIISKDQPYALVRNDSPELVTLARGTLLGTLRPADIKGAY
jgi:hypothetical protein